MQTANHVADAGQEFDAHIKHLGCRKKNVIRIWISWIPERPFMRGVEIWRGNTRRGGVCDTVSLRWRACSNGKQPMTQMQVLMWVKSEYKPAPISAWATLARRPLGNDRVVDNKWRQPLNRKKKSNVLEFWKLEKPSMLLLPHTDWR